MKLEAYRQSRGWTYQRLGELLGMRRDYAWQICNGSRPSSDLAARISAATDGLVTIEELLYPDGVPDGAVVARQRDEDAGGYEPPAAEAA